MDGLQARKATLLENTLKAWRTCLEPTKDAKPKNSLEAAGLELVGTEVVENKILASRLVMTVNDKVFAQLDDLRVRIKLLENLDDLDGGDILRPEVLVLQMVEQWAQSGMPGDSWPLVNDTAQAKLITKFERSLQERQHLDDQQGCVANDRVKGSGTGASPCRGTATASLGTAARYTPASPGSTFEWIGGLGIRRRLSTGSQPRRQCAGASEWSAGLQRAATGSCAAVWWILWWATGLGKFCTS